MWTRHFNVDAKSMGKGASANQVAAQNDTNGAIVALTSPYLNQKIHKMTDGDTAKDKAANLAAHALLSAVEFQVTGKYPLTGAIAGVTGEATAEILTRTLYNKAPDQLTASEKENISTLSQVAGGLAGALTAKANGSTDQQGGTFLTATAGAETAKRAVENNYLFRQEAEEKAVLERKVKNNQATEEEKVRLSQLEKLDSERDRAIIMACSGSVSSQSCLSLVNEANYAKFGYEQNLSYNLKFKELYPNDYQNVEKILKGKDADSVEFEKIAINFAQGQNISLDEAKSILSKIYAFRAGAEFTGSLVGMAALNHAGKALPKGVVQDVSTKKVDNNGVKGEIGRSTKIGTNSSKYNAELNKKIDIKPYSPKSIFKKDGYYHADGMKISENYYEKLWNNGRKAPFIQAREIIQSNPKITPDDRGKVGFYRYESNGLEMIYNPQTKEIWHIQPIKGTKNGKL
ncbi:hypothetical protein BKK51_08485 [Rodentibacter trehalosifermentans]|uniref:Uncharacterized protein n=2 Tax=Rodentibacter trehalosifermentans TaxID=1908263 RepID=A0A1V3IRM7_9PAST|nr:VENN motif pre-toxin domain-containing protein [Rodentibacter trehalosifermentans]OOF44700.1 hypothetical protein BKK51_08485 [Rodentibacter trehalosifermentans]